MNPSFEKFKKGLPLTRKGAITAQCFECNGFSLRKDDDCLGISCPLYQWSPWGKSLILKQKNPQKWQFQRKKTIDKEAI